MVDEVYKVDEVDIHPLEKIKNYLIFRVDEYQPYQPHQPHQPLTTQQHEILLFYTRRVSPAECL